MKDKIFAFVERNDKAISLGCVLVLGTGLVYSSYKGAQHKKILYALSHVVFTEMGLREQVLDHLHSTYPQLGSR